MRTQSDTQAGMLPLLTAVSLIGKEGLLTVMTADGLDEVQSQEDLALYLVLEGESETSAKAEALHPGRNVRVRALGAGSKGDILILADPVANSGEDAGKVAALDDETGALFSPGIAEEDFVDGQLVRMRPFPRVIGGVDGGNPIAFTGATPADTAAATTSYGFAEAQANALIANVREIRAALIAKGIMADNV